jgi:hypothetical protein
MLTLDKKRQRAFFVCESISVVLYSVLEILVGLKSCVTIGFCYVGFFGLGVVV